jgi:hypothetical protein
VKLLARRSTSDRSVIPSHGLSGALPGQQHQVNPFSSRHDDPAATCLPGSAPTTDHSAVPALPSLLQASYPCSDRPLFLQDMTAYCLYVANIVPTSTLYALNLRLRLPSIIMRGYSDGGDVFESSRTVNVPLSRHLPPSPTDLTIFTNT